MGREQGGGRCWIAVYEHRHGVDVWPVFGDEPPEEEELAAGLDDWEPERGERIEVRGPWPVPGCDR